MCEGLPQSIAILKFNFSATYYMEVLRGDVGKQTKIYESEWFVNDPNHEFD